MSNKTGLQKFVPPNGTSHVEIASVNFDQWILTVGIRLYKKKDESVMGMAHVVFEQPLGFRVLDEGAMLSFPWSSLSDEPSYVHLVRKGGWLDMERDAANIFTADNVQEYVIVTCNECVSVIAYSEPKLVESANK